MLPLTTRSGQLPWDYPNNGNWRIVLADPARGRRSTTTEPPGPSLSMRMIRYMQDNIVDLGEWTNRRSSFMWASSGRGDYNRDGQQVRHIFVANYIKDQGLDIEELNEE